MGVETAFEVGRLYQPIKAISDILTSSREDIFTNLPGIEGHYPMSVVNSTGRAISDTGAGSPLIQTGLVPVGYDGNSYRQLGNGTNYLSAVGVYGLTGTETFISSSIRGFTIGGWFWLDSVPTSTSGLISRSAVIPQLGYELKINSLREAKFLISNDGTALVQVDGPLISLTEWHFIVARFIPSVEIAMFVDGVKLVETSGIPSSCFVSSGQFEVARLHGSDTQILTVKCRDVFICWSALSDALISTIRTATAP